MTGEPIRIGRAFFRFVFPEGETIPYHYTEVFNN